MPKHLSQKFTEDLHRNPWWTYKHDIYEKPNGEDGDYYYGETPGYTTTVPMLPDGRLLLTIQYRYLNQKPSIEFPGGGIKPDLDVESAARLELKEETGYLADSIVKLGTFEPTSGLLKDMTHVFLAYVSEAGAQVLDDTEEIELITRRPDEFQRMVQNGEIWCGQTLAAWALVQSYLSKQDEDSKFLEAPNVKRLTDSIFGILICRDMDRETLVQILTDANIDLSLWGNGDAKSVDDLAHELAIGDATLVQTESGLQRIVVGGGADVYYTDPSGGKYHLVEDRQVFFDGRERTRSIGESVGEKIRYGEDIESGMIRGLREELQITGDITLEKIGVVEETHDSPSYPGLVSVYTRHVFRVELTEEQFNKDGYVETEGDTTTYFVWKQVTQ